jgi:hypothetical protein
MANKSITDRGNAHAAITFERLSGEPPTCDVTIYTSDGRSETVRIAPGTVYTAAERATLIALLGKAYTAALAAAGFA